MPRSRSFVWIVVGLLGALVVGVLVGMAIPRPAPTVSIPTAVSLARPTLPPATAQAEPQPTAVQAAEATAIPVDTAGRTPPRPPGAALDVALVFVSRQIPPKGSIYMEQANDMPGVGPHSRFRPAAPGRLVVREADGSERVLIDGAQPSEATLNLIDVNAPDVSYDGSTIVFAGLPQGSYENEPARNPGAWRIYSIRTDGSSLRQVTNSDMQLDLAQFGPAAGGLAPYDDTDPAWLPDGRIVFASTRWPSFAQYSGVRTTNLHVVRDDGSDLRRITAERNGADRPLIDPLTGRIVYARWWRNQRFALDDMSTVEDGNGGYKQNNGLSANRDLQLDGRPEQADALWRNAWQAAAINPDGTGLALWTGATRNEEANHVYGGAFTPDGTLIANYFPMFNMTEAGGFGGLRRYTRGANSYTPVAGVTSLTLDYIQPNSFGIFKGPYASEPAVLPDGRLVFSIAQDERQDYGLYVAEADGSNPRLLLDSPGTAELRVRVLAPRTLPPVIPDQIQANASLLPPGAEKPYDQDGTFVFEVLNIYANGPVDLPIVSAPPVGSAGTLRFFLDHQRTSPGSFPNLDWPILLGEMPVAPDGYVIKGKLPANLPVFEQLRTPDGRVPRTGGPNADGAAHVAGMNFGRPGEWVRCVGCHAGHSQLPVPASQKEAQWSNLAPGAQISASSSRDPRYDGGLVDRQVLRGEIWRYWSSQPGQPAAGQWVQLTFPVPVDVRTVRLYNPRPGDEAASSLQVRQATVRLYADEAATQEVGAATVRDVQLSGSEATFEEVRARSVRVYLDEVQGSFYGAEVASLAEIEVIARGAP
ncbi:MAG: hypothetical protein OHK0022_45400 [Roseiflexaceae bacterium]